MSSLREEIRFALQAPLHPVTAFDAVKWEGGGSLRVSAGILILLVLQAVITRQNTGFIYNFNNLERLNVFAIFAANIGVFLLWFVSNVGVSRLMFGEGDARRIWISTAYSLLPFIFVNLLLVLLSNAVSLALGPFLIMLQVIGYLWTAVMIYTAVFIVHQFSFSRSFLNIFLTLFGILIIMFILLLLYSLAQQIYIFLATIVNELLFRL